MLASGARNGHFAVYNLTQQTEIINQKIHNGKVCGLKFYESGKSLISSGDDGLIHFWNSKDLIESKHIKVSNSGISAFDANPRKNLILTASQHNKISLYDFNGNLKKNFETKLVI